MDKEKIKQLCKDYQDGNLRIDQFTDALEKEGVSAWIGYVLHDLHREVRFLTNIGKLSAEEQVTAYRWRKAREDRRVLSDKLFSIDRKTNEQEFQNVLLQMRRTDPSHCEHGRSTMSNCMACDRIERTLYPDMFPPEEEDEG